MDEGRAGLRYSKICLHTSDSFAFTRFLTQREARRADSAKHGKKPQGYGQLHSWSNLSLNLHSNRTNKGTQLKLPIAFKLVCVRFTSRLDVRIQ